MGSDAGLARRAQAPPRQWGYWTRFKLELLADYLDSFTRASKNQAELVYLDAFAGEGSGVDRLTGEEFRGSARIALEVTDAAFTRLRYFELAGQAGALRDALLSEYPGRDVLVYAGDCNETIPRALDELAELRWAPIFAFLDPDGMELAWSTLEALSRHKLGYRTTDKPEYKVEMWILFPSGGLIRTLALDESRLRDADAERATRLFGTDQWRRTYEMRVQATISGTEARDAYVNLLRWRVEKELGYSRTHPLEIKNERGVPLYHMIFATDNEAGDRIMTDLYSKAADRSEQMRQEARDRRTGVMRLFDIGIGRGERLYRCEAPTDPST